MLHLPDGYKYVYCSFDDIVQLRYGGFANPGDDSDFLVIIVRLKKMIWILIHLKLGMTYLS